MNWTYHEIQFSRRRKSFDFEIKYEALVWYYLERVSYTRGRKVFWIAKQNYYSHNKIFAYFNSLLLKWITFAINCFICDEPNSGFVSKMGEISNIIMILASYHIILSIQHLHSAYPSTLLHPCHVHEAKCIQIECHVNASVNCGTVQNVNKVSIDVIPRWITCTS